MIRPRKIVAQRAQSRGATCERTLIIGSYPQCGAPLRLVIRDHDIAERCAFGHYAAQQAVIGDPPMTLNYEWDDDATGYV